MILETERGLGGTKNREFFTYVVRKKIGATY
jgi:hypothetical protein